MDENVTSMSNSGSKINIWVMFLVGIMIVFSILLLVFLYFQTKKTKAPAATTPSITTSSSEIIASPKSYFNSKFFYSFVCPKNSRHIDVSREAENSNKTFLQDVCEEEGGKNRVDIYVTKSNNPDIVIPIEVNKKEFESKSGEIRVLLEGGDKDYFDQVVSSFKFTE